MTEAEERSMQRANQRLEVAKSIMWEEVLPSLTLPALACGLEKKWFFMLSEKSSVLLGKIVDDLYYHTRKYPFKVFADYLYGTLVNLNRMFREWSYFPGEQLAHQINLEVDRASSAGYYAFHCVYLYKKDMHEQR